MFGLWVRCVIEWWIFVFVIVGVGGVLVMGGDIDVVVDDGQYVDYFDLYEEQVEWCVVFGEICVDEEYVQYDDCESDVVGIYVYFCWLCF